MYLKKSADKLCMYPSGSVTILQQSSPRPMVCVRLQISFGCIYCTPEGYVNGSRHQHGSFTIFLFVANPASGQDPCIATCRACTLPVCELCRFSSVYIRYTERKIHLVGCMLAVCWLPSKIFTNSQKFCVRLK